MSGALCTRLFRLWRRDSVKYLAISAYISAQQPPLYSDKVQNLAATWGGGAAKPRAFNKGRYGRRFATKMAE